MVTTTMIKCDEDDDTVLQFVHERGLPFDIVDIGECGVERSEDAERPPEKHSDHDEGVAGRGCARDRVSEEDVGTRWEVGTDLLYQLFRELLTADGGDDNRQQQEDGKQGDERVIRDAPRHELDVLLPHLLHDVPTQRYHTTEPRVHTRCTGREPKSSTCHPTEYRSSFQRIPLAPSRQIPLAPSRQILLAPSRRFKPFSSHFRV